MDSIRIKSELHKFVLLLFQLFLFGFACQLHHLPLAHAEDAIEPKIDFSSQVKPIFTRHCTSCHGGVKQIADISFVHGEDIVAPEGWIVEPGDPEASVLMERILSDDPDLRMPPPDHGPALDKEEKEILNRWILEGATWGKHWAFVKPRATPLPQVRNTNWPKQPIDHFILASLESRGLSPASQASPERWLRRVTLDLTGLPPTPEERKSFLAELEKAELQSDTESCYVAVVDRLLASKSFGERWASVWLDQVRYADSKGLGMDGPRNIWKYRDWVIDSFNEDMPFDQFTIKQIAGDLLPDARIGDYIATAAHRLTQTNEEGGTDDEEFRVAAILDRTNTTWQAWQGVTFGCVQCHSHPYDPVRHEEYYQFAAFFNNTADCDLGEDWPTVKAPNDVRRYNEASELDQKIFTVANEIWLKESEVAKDGSLWTSVSSLKASTNNKTRVNVIDADGVAEFHTVDTVSQNTDVKLSAELPSKLEQITGIQLTARPLHPEQALTDSEWGFVLSQIVVRLKLPGQDAKPLGISMAIGDEAQPFHDPDESLNEKSKVGFSAYTRISRDRVVTFVLDHPVDLAEGAELELVLKHRVSALGAFPLVTKRGRLSVTDSEKLTELLSSKPLQEKRELLDKLKKLRKAIPSTSVPVFRERPSHLSRSQQVFIRGLYLDKGETVEPNTPAAFRELPQGSPRDRMSLARWLVSRENPLTARVAVNRLWARIFGIGIVATEEDFGSSGEMPAHPILLDYLAVKFQDELQWSQKQLLREMVLSSTYRQSSVIRPEIHKFDQGNRLLARGPRTRLPSEIVRDQSLAIAGLLSKKMAGPPVRPPLPDGVWKPFAGWDKWNTPSTDSEDRYRRAIYTYTKRSIPYPMFAAFDAPSREVCTPRRLQSNTPIQALMNLNDQTMTECFAAFGKRMQGFKGELREKIEYGFTLATCREPRQGELQPLISLHESMEKDEDQNRWQAIAGVLLNLDEVLMK